LPTFLTARLLSPSTPSPTRQLLHGPLFSFSSGKLMVATRQ
jgi:hypothetical protein